MLKLSVIIPVYNVEKYLAKCLESVIDERFADDYEVIIINDGATDSSPVIAQEYVAAHPTLVRMISTENCGLGHARNVGIENSAGEFLCFIDSDDYLVDGAIEKLLEMCNHNKDICIYDASSVRDDGSEIKYISGCKLSGAVSLDEYPELLLEIPNAWNKLCRRTLFTDNEIAFPDRAWFEDIRTMLKLYAIAASIEHVAEPLYKYVQHANTITRAKKPDRNVEIIDAMDDIIGFFKTVGKYERFSDVLEYLAFHSQFLTSSVRANLAKWNTPVQDKLIDDYLAKFPNFHSNPYVQNISGAHKLLLKLYMKKKYLAVHILMKANNIIKGTNF